MTPDTRAIADHALTADFTGLTALVTGASSGLGERFAVLLAEKGAQVVVTGRRAERLQGLVDRIGEAGGKAHAVALDVTDPASITACLDQAEAAAGPVHILINNAGMNVQGFATELSEDDYDRIMDTNVKGVYFTAREAAKRMIARGEGGQIVNIASIGAFRTLPGLSAYCASKASVAMLTQSFAREWARYGINVNAICPGYITTEINEAWFETEAGQKQVNRYPRKRLGVAEDLDGALLLLASPANRFLTGALLTVDDAQSLTV